VTGAGQHPAPVLITDRLVLRGFVAEDFDAHSAILAKPEVNAFLGAPMSREDLWRRVVSSVGMWGVLGYGGWMVTIKDGGRIVGNVGLFDAKRGIGFDGYPEMGWIFDPSVHGQGIAREACEAVIGWAEANIDGPLWAIIAPENQSSQRIAARLGFVTQGSVDYHGEPVDILRRELGRS